MSKAKHPKLIKRAKRRAVTWLAVVRTNLDELPIMVTTDQALARKTCKAITHDEIDKLAEMIGVDCAGRICAAIISFDKSGKPIEIENVRDFDDDEVKEAA